MNSVEATRACTGHRLEIIIEKRQNKNIKVCRRSRADLNNNSKEGTAESVKGQRAVAPLTLIKESWTAKRAMILENLRF